MARRPSMPRPWLVAILRLQDPPTSTISSIYAIVVVSAPSWVQLSGDIVVPMLASEEAETSILSYLFVTSACTIVEPR